MGDPFPTTHWSEILAARDRADPEGRRALEALAAAYWRPLYGYFRRKDLRPDEAENAVQELFARLLDRDSLASVSPDAGRFRTFLLVVAQRLLHDLREHAVAQKRGGGWNRVPLDFAETESTFRPAADESPEDAYRREWGRALFETALARLRIELEVGGRGAYFAVLRDFYGVGTSESTLAYAEIARRHGLSTTDVANFLHRSRRRLREIVLEEIRRSVASDADVAGELGDLFGAFE